MQPSVLDLGIKSAYYIIIPIPYKYTQQSYSRNTPPRTSGRTGSSIPTMAIQVRPEMILSSLSQSGDAPEKRSSF
jgi:hypothetical protein